MCPKCKDYIGRCPACGTNLNKATTSVPIGKPVLPVRRPVTPADDNPTPKEAP